MSTQRSGAITLLTVFLTGGIAFLLLMADNIRVAEVHARVRAQTISEQAFYAAQSCLEEGLYQLRSNTSYTGSTTVTVGDGTCSATVDPDPVNPRQGTLRVSGVADKNIRTIASGYTDAGGVTTRNPTRIMHLLDTSGSMQEDSCSNTTYRTKTNCQFAGFTWGPVLQPISTAKDAAIAFNNQFLDPAYDTIGVVSYSTNATLRIAPTNNLTTLNNAISTIGVPSGSTDIGAAITMAAGQLPASGTTMRVMLLLTDGVPNSTTCPEACVRQRAATAKASGITIYTIGLGTGVNAGLLRDLASVDAATGDALYYPAPTSAELAAIYNQIANRITTYGISLSSWNEE